MFSEFDLTKEDDKSTEIDFNLLSEMFCRREEDIKAEEEKKKAALIKKAQSESKQRSVLEIK